MRTSLLLGLTMAGWTNSSNLSSFGQLTATKVQNELNECDLGFVIPPSFMGIPTAAALCICLPIEILGVCLNAFVLWLMVKQKEHSHQDCYVIVLCVFGFVMSFPVFAYTIFMELFRCHAWPPFINDIWLFLVQWCAGVTIWLVGAISIDRLLMIVYHARYPIYVTRRRVYLKIGVVIAFYFFVCFCINYSPYIAGTYFHVIDPMKPAVGRPTASFIAPTPLTKYLNQLRMFTDRVLPWLVCTGVYLAIFAARRQHKKSFNKQTAINGQQEAQASDRVKKGKKLAIGISVSLFVFLLPETVFDVAQYIFHADLTSGHWEILSVLWYGLNAVNPVVYLLSLPKLRNAAIKVLSTCKKLKTGKINADASQRNETPLEKPESRRPSCCTNGKLELPKQHESRRQSVIDLEIA